MKKKISDLGFPCHIPDGLWSNSKSGAHGRRRRRFSVKLCWLSPLTQFLLHPSTEPTRRYTSHSQDCCETVIRSRETQKHKHYTFPPSPYLHGARCFWKCPTTFVSSFYRKRSTMAGSFINRLNCAFQRLENTFSFIFDRFYRGTKIT